MLTAGFGAPMVLVTEAQQTQRAITALIGLLLVVGAMLAILTFWYWRHTSPRRRVQNRYVDVDDGGPRQAFDQGGHGSGPSDVYAGGRYFSPDEAVDVGDSYSDTHR